MLDDLLHRAAPLDVTVRTLCGRWPDIAPQAPTADVVLCHHVLYNVADIAPFAAAPEQMHDLWILITIRAAVEVCVGNATGGSR
jgi:hypothetical protein